MNYSATFDVKNPDLLKLLKVEYKDIKKERFQVEIDESIKVTATDATALKAIINSIVNSFVIFEKMEKIK